MKLEKGSIYLPRHRKEGPVKYLCICAHPDDAEIMAIDGIQRGYRAKKYSFACVVTTSEPVDGEDLGFFKNAEQKKAADVGRYNSLYILKYTPEEIKDPENDQIVNEYVKIIKELKPSIIYTHSILDKNLENLSVATKVINALRKMKRAEHPRVLYGCEVWRDLDWVNPEKIVYFNNSRNIRLQKTLLAAHKKQNEVRTYVEAAIGRRYTNTVFNNKAKPSTKLSTRAINMTTLLRRKDLPIKRYAMSFVDDLYTEINDAMDRTL